MRFKVARKTTQEKLYHPSTFLSRTVNEWTVDFFLHFHHSMRWKEWEKRDNGRPLELTVKDSYVSLFNLVIQFHSAKKQKSSLQTNPINHSQFLCSFLGWFCKQCRYFHFLMLPQNWERMWEPTCFLLDGHVCKSKMYTIYNIHVSVPLRFRRLARHTQVQCWWHTKAHAKRNSLNCCVFFAFQLFIDGQPLQCCEKGEKVNKYVTLSISLIVDYAGDIIFL